MSFDCTSSRHVSSFAALWYALQFAQRKNMKSGTLNESNLIKHIVNKKYINFVADIGLVDHKTEVGISVSADGVCNDECNHDLFDYDLNDCCLKESNYMYPIPNTKFMGM